MAKAIESIADARLRSDPPSQSSKRDSRDILETVGCIIIGLSPDHRIYHWNREAERLFGVTSDDVLGRNYFDLFPPPESHDQLSASIRSVLSGDPTSGFENAVRVPEGSERVISWTVRPHLNDQEEPIGVVACGQDVTDRTRYRPERYVSDPALACDMPAISRLDAAGRYVEVNESYARMLGREPEEMIGSSWEGTVHPEDRTHVVDAYQKLQKGEQVEVEARAVRKDGSTFQKLILMVRIPSPDGEFVGHHCLMRDITDEIREAALKAAHNHVLDLLTKEAPLNDILSVIVRSVEDQIDGIACTVLVFDSSTQTLKLGVGPGLPRGYLEAVDEMPVGPHATPCGLAAYLNQELIVENILTDPRCKQAVSLAKKYGLRSCRPMPIRDQNGHVLGIYSLYLTGDRWPSDSEMHWIKTAVGLSGLVIERQQTREILRENEAVFQALAETVQLIPWEMELQTKRFTYIGPQAERLLGYEYQSEGRFSASFWNDFLHPSDRDRVNEHFEKAMQHEDDFVCDYRVKTASGQDRWFHNIVHVERDGQRPTKLRGSMIDITRRKEAEETAEGTNKLLAALTRAQSQFIAEVDSRDLFEELNRNLLALTNSEYGFIGEVLLTNGRSPYLKTQAITNIAWNQETRDFYDKHAPQGMEFFNLDTLFGVVIETGKPVISNSPATDPRRGGLPAGHPALNSFLGLPFYRGDRMVGMIGMANRPGGYDTQLVEYLDPVLTTCGSMLEAYRNERLRKEAEAALAEAHENLEKRVQERTAEVTAANEQLRIQAQLLKSVREAIFATDLEGHVTYWGNGAVELYGHSTEEVLGRPISIIEGNSHENEEIRRLLEARERGSWTGEHIQWRKNGTSFWADSFISLVTDTQKKPTGFIHISHDISARKRAEEELQQRQYELAHISRLSTMGEMATGLAHEINQPLHTISNYVEGALVRVETGNLETNDLRDALTHISASAQQAGEIVRRLRGFVSKFEPRRSSVDVNDLILDAVKMVDFEAKRSQVKVQLHLAEQLPLVLADSVPIQQVMLNLLRNAFQAMETQSISNRTIAIETLRIDNGTVQVEVRDSGPGIKAIPSDRIFDAFFTTKVDGLGMGLAISRSIIEAHSGRLWVLPNPNEGATFLFTLPVPPGESDGESS